MNVFTKNIDSINSELESYGFDYKSMLKSDKYKLLISIYCENNNLDINECNSLKKYKDKEHRIIIYMNCIQIIDNYILSPNFSKYKLEKLYYVYINMEEYILANYVKNKLNNLF